MPFSSLGKESDDYSSPTSRRLNVSSFSLLFAIVSVSDVLRIQILIMTTISFSLRNTFGRFKEASLDGVSGVKRIDSGKPGPVLGITACTHGNEPSGLAIFEYLLKEINIEKELVCGTLYLVVNNIQATEKFFSATNEEEVRNSRYCDVNMNRLPKNTLHLVNDVRYEVKRAQDLYPIWEQFEYGLDVHSTLEPTDPVIISRGGEFHPELARGFPIETLISNIDQVQIGSPTFAFYGGLGSNTQVFAIEAGQHTDPKSFDRAAACASAFLQNLGMLPGTPNQSISEYREYLIDGSIIFPDLSYDFVKDFKHLDSIKKKDLLARNPGGIEIRASFDGHLIMPTSRRGDKKYPNEEASFLSRPAKKRRI
jgi:predicted deacylase